MESVEVDEWVARPFEPFESISVLADDGYRKKIDMWHQDYARQREIDLHRRQAEDVWAVGLKSLKRRRSF